MVKTCSQARSPTRVVPAATGHGPHPPCAFKLGVVPVADLVADQCVRQFSVFLDVKLGKLMQEVLEGHPAGSRERGRGRKSQLPLTSDSFTSFLHQKHEAGRNDLHRWEKTVSSPTRTLHRQQSGPASSSPPAEHHPTPLNWQKVKTNPCHVSV